MTAEVAILNREAVALAADGAVTFMGLEGRKIYNTNKLFALSMTEPIAVMVYGTGSFGTSPVGDGRERISASTSIQTI